MKGVRSIPPPLNEALYQGGAHILLRKKTDDGLKASLSDIALGFGDKKIVLVHHLIGASPASIRG